MSAGPVGVMAWLDAREPLPPPGLRAHIDRALERHVSSMTGDGESIVTTLAEAALHALAVAVERCDDRAAANDLLAADALLTYAMEAAGSMGGEAVEAVARAYGGARLTALIPEHS